MRCRYRSANGRLEFEVEGDTQKAIFAHVANLQEIFEADSACGCCGADDIRFRVRQAENKLHVKCDYYELHCAACNARLSFGQHQTGGTLFVKRKDANGAVMPNRGWYVYQASDQDHEEEPAQAPSRPATPTGKFPTPTPPNAGPKTPVPAKPQSGQPALAPADAHARTVRALREAVERQNADEWLGWGAKQPRTLAQRTEQETEHKAALERIAMKERLAH